MGISLAIKSFAEELVLKDSLLVRVVLAESVDDVLSLFGSLLLFRKLLAMVNWN